MQAHGFLTRREVDAAQRVGNGRNRLESCARDDRRAVGGPSFDASGVVGGAGQMSVLSPHDLVVCRGAEQSSLRKTVSDFNALDRLDRHEGGRQARIEALASGHVGTQADGNVVCDHFGDATNRIARLLGGIDGRLEASVILRIKRAHRGLA